MQYLREGKRYPPAEYPRMLADTFGRNAAAVAEHYPLTNFPGVPLAYSAAVTDGVFACVNERMAAALARHGDRPVHFYEFNDRDAPAPEPLRTLPFPVGASHSLELRYLFDVGDAPPLDAAQQRLSDQMIDYWTAFVRTGSPQVDGQPDWPGFGTANEVMSLQPDGSRAVGSFAAEHQCPFWDGLR